MHLPEDMSNVRIQRNQANIPDPLRSRAVSPKLLLIFEMLNLLLSLRPQGAIFLGLNEEDHVLNTLPIEYVRPKYTDVPKVQSVQERQVAPRGPS
jgi:hypothetical protein